MYVFGAVAVAQGIFLCGMLWLHGGERQANRWLAMALGAFSLVTASDVLVRSGAIEQVPHLAYLFDWMIFLIGPLMYRYVVTLTSDAPLTRTAALLHSLPALLLLAVLSPLFLQTAANKLLLARTDMHAVPRLDPLLLVAAAQVLCYWIACLAQLRRFRRQLTQQFSNLEALKSGWLSLLLAGNFLLWAAWLATLLFGKRSEWIESLATPIAIYGLGYVGLQTPRVFQTPDNAAVAVAVPKYAKSVLGPGQLEALQQRLIAFVNLEKPFLEDRLTLDALATRLAMPPHHLSQVLSLGMKQSFYDYMNGHRVAEVQRCLLDPAYERLSILDIALASGFSSKATFNAVFKKQSGMTPSNFRAKRGKNV